MIRLPSCARLLKGFAPGSLILDVGCGSGRDLLWFKERGFHVTGFERSPGLAELARENAGCEVIEGDFELYDFSGLSADAVVLAGALVHISHERFQQVFGNIMAGLKDRGYVLVSFKEGAGERMDSRGRVFHGFPVKHHLSGRPICPCSCWRCFQSTSCLSSYPHRFPDLPILPPVQPAPFSSSRVSRKPRTEFLIRSCGLPEHKASTSAFICLEIRSAFSRWLPSPCPLTPPEAQTGWI